MSVAVCLSVLLHSSKNDTFKLHQSFDAGHSRQWLGFLWRRRCDTLCTSAYTNDVILTDNGRIGGISELTYYTHYYLFRTQSKKTLRSVSRLVAHAGLKEYCQWERLDRVDAVLSMGASGHG